MLENGQEKWLSSKKGKVKTYILLFNHILLNQKRPLQFSNIASSLCPLLEDWTNHEGYVAYPILHINVRAEWQKTGHRDVP